LYRIRKTKNQALNLIELISSGSTSKAQICLEQGGRLSDFIFNNIQVLAQYKLSDYKSNYASSILFPFANRIKNGEYAFNGKTFKLNCNESDKNNALHGLVYNKTFNLIHQETSLDFALIKLQYTDAGINAGFPYKYSVELTYKLSNSGLSLIIDITNNDDNSFPYTLGWHPYFHSDNLDTSYLNFKSDIKHTYDKQQIVTGTEALDIEMPYHLQNEKLDDSFELLTAKVQFSTPQYSFGCSNPHPHGQIWSQSSLPNEVLKKDKQKYKYYNQNKRSLLGNYLKQELQLKERIIYQNNDFVVLTPFWAIWPFETMIVPKKSYSNIVELSHTQNIAFADALFKITKAYDKLFDCSFPYSSGIHQAPTNGKDNVHWHWHMSFYPPLLRSATVKKFMVGYEMFGSPQRDITAEQAVLRLKGLID